MADITLVISGDAKGAGDALKKVAAGAKEAGLKVEEAGAKSEKSGETTARSMFKAQVAFHIAAKAAKELIRFLEAGVQEIVKEDKAIDSMRSAMGLTANTSRTLGKELAGVEEAQKALSKEFARATLGGFAWLTGYKDAAEYVSKLKEGLQGLAEYFSKSGELDRDRQSRLEQEVRLSAERLTLVERIAGTQARINNPNEHDALKSRLRGLIADDRERLRVLEDQLAVLARQKEAGSKAAIEQAKADAEAAKAKTFDAEKFKSEKEKEDEAEREWYRNWSAQLEKQEKDEQKRRAEFTKNRIAHEISVAGKSLEIQVDAANKEKAINERRLQDARDVADRMANAIGSALESSLRSLASGEEFDFAGVIVSILQTAVSTALAGTPFAFLAPAASGLIGGLGSFAKPRPSAHAGAWATNLPRYHSGGSPYDEVAAVLRADERVLSGAEINRMGGPLSVDRMARGGGGGGGYTIVLANDAKSFEDRVRGDYGSGMTRAIRMNRGDLAREVRRIARGL